MEPETETETEMELEMKTETTSPSFRQSHRPSVLDTRRTRCERQIITFAHGMPTKKAEEEEEEEDKEEA